MTLKIQSNSFCLGALLLFAQSVQAIDIDNFNTATNDRFANSGTQFIANGYDLSGVAITDGGKWVTMISDRVFLTSEHFAPSNGESVTFYASNDPTGGTATRSVASSQRIGQSDIRIGVLDNPLGSSFAAYSFATQDITDDASFFGNSDFTLNENTYLFGRSPEPNAFPTSQDMAVGQNKLDLFYGSITAEGTTDSAVAAVWDQSTDTNYVSFESLLKPGDSGAPLMVDDGSGNLVLVGLNWFIQENAFVSEPVILESGNLDEEFKFRTVNGFAYVGNYDEDIESYANAVPEPATFGFFLGLTFLALATIRRRQSD